MSSRHLLPLLLFALAVVAHSVPAAEATLLEDTCKYVANKSSLSVDYEFCVTSLQVDARSQTAQDASVLGLVAVDLTLANATLAQTKIKSLLESGSVDPATKDLLKQCASFYDELSSLFGGAAKDLAAKAYKNASAKLSEGAGKPGDCEDLVSEGGKIEQLAEVNEDSSELATISDLVVASLLSK